MWLKLNLFGNLVSWALTVAQLVIWGSDQVTVFDL